MAAVKGFSEANSKEVEVEGHLIDSMILSRIWDRIIELDGDFEVVEFRVGKRKTDTSYVRMFVKGKSPKHLDEVLRDIYLLGAVPLNVEEVTIKSAPANMVLPKDFYLTTNNPTFIYFEDKWIEVDDLMMDKVIAIEKKLRTAYCKPSREVKKGDLIVVGEKGVRVKPPERSLERTGIFQFMDSDTSSEKPAAVIIGQIALDLSTVKRSGGKIAVVAGPAVVHTGAATALASLIRMGFVDVLLAGNALAVHDVEASLFGTSLGVSLLTGISSIRGRRNHIEAINEVHKAGGLKAMVEKNILKKGIMYECIKGDVPFVLAGSIRDDGPLPDVIIDMNEAQKRYRQKLEDVSLVLMLSTALHSIAVGNMLPSTVKLVCVDINPSTVTKLLDRGSSQTIGIISDVGTLLPLLAEELKKLNA